VPGFLGPLLVNQDLAGKDQRLRTGPALNHPAVNQHFVESFLNHLSHLPSMRSFPLES
jgi:hypothetical protein